MTKSIKMAEFAEYLFSYLNQGKRNSLNLLNFICHTHIYKIRMFSLDGDFVLWATQLNSLNREVRTQLSGTWSQHHNDLSIINEHYHFDFIWSVSGTSHIGCLDRLGAAKIYLAVLQMH